LSKENSNFKNAALIVPTFYTIAALSLKTPQLYRILGTTNTLDLTTEVLKDRILSVENEDFSFIPRQENYTNKVRLYFNENPSTDGIYKIQNNNIAVQNISFNYDRKESALNYTPITQLNAKNVETNLHDLFTELQKDNSINAFWKWFVIFTLVFMVLELLFQKFIP